MLEAFESVGNLTMNQGSSTDGGPMGNGAFSLKSNGHAVLDTGMENGEDIDEGEVEDVVAEEDGQEAGQMAQDEKGTYRWIGPSNTLSFIERFSAQEGSQIGESPDQNKSDTSPRDSLSSAKSTNLYFTPLKGSGVVKAISIDEVNYPIPEAAEEMIDEYFKSVHPCMPVVIEHHFREEYANLMERRSRGENERSGGFISVAFAIFALGERAIVTSRAWQRERAKLHKNEVGSETTFPGEAEAGVVWYERASVLHYSTHSDVNMHQVQCLTLMSCFQASVNSVPMCWLLAGQAIRVAQDLGLHRSTARLPLSFAEKQLRARCWWSIYGLDRTTSVSLGRPLCVDDLDIDVPYPAAIDDATLLRIEREGLDPAEFEGIGEEHGSVMSGFIAVTKLTVIIGQTANMLYRASPDKNENDPLYAQNQHSKVNKLDKAIRDWLLNEVPSKYKDPSSNPSVQLMSAILSNTYFAALLRLHRNFLPADPAYPRPKFPLSIESMSKCVDAARSVIHTAAQSRILIPPSHYLPILCQYLWNSAVILLLCEVQAKDQIVVDAVGAQVEACRRSLRALEPVWPGCRKLKELLSDVEKRTKEMRSAAKNGVTPIKALPKKRKISSARSPIKTNVPPPAFTSPIASPGGDGLPWPGPSIAGLPGNVTDEPNKRPRTSTYEMSNSRSNLPPNFALPSLPVVANGSALSATPSSTPVFSPNHVLPQELFDLGGVNFDGLDMLQGFNGSNMASLWTSLAENNFVNSAANSPRINTLHDLNQPIWSEDQYGTPHGLTMQHRIVSNGDTTGSAETNNFWAEVTGTNFDWQTDPNVPFNI